MSSIDPKGVLGKYPLARSCFSLEPSSEPSFFRQALADSYKADRALPNIPAISVQDIGWVLDGLRPYLSCITTQMARLATDPGVFRGSLSISSVGIRRCLDTSQTIPQTSCSILLNFCPQNRLILFCEFFLWQVRFLWCFACFAGLLYGSLNRQS